MNICNELCSAGRLAWQINFDVIYKFVRIPVALACIS